MSLRPRIALVTGAAQGIGRGIANALAAAGHVVIVSDIDEAAAQVVAREINESGHEARAAFLNVRNESDFELAVSQALDLGGVDILVNNAALTKAGHWQEIDVAEWQDVLDVNLRGTLFGCRQVAPGMIERGWGRIINLTSGAGLGGGRSVQGVHYATSKAGIAQLTRYIAYDLAPKGITVNAISPGATDTPQIAFVPENMMKALLAGVPMGRLAQPSEIGAAAAFLASDAASFITGAILDVNGGAMMR